jgi:DNA polymerase-3 subunit alpha
VESLIRCGAFDSFGSKRRQLEIAFPEIRKSLLQNLKEQQEGQFSLFGETEDMNINYTYPDVDEYSKKEKLIFEKEVTGLYLSDHPMKDYADLAEKEGYPTIGMINSDESEFTNNSKVSVMGILSKVSKKMTKNETMMAILALQDLTGTIEVLLFSKAYEKYSHLLVEDKIVVVTGKVSIDDFERDRGGAGTGDDEVVEEKRDSKIICSEITEVKSPTIITAPPPTENLNKKLVITFTKNDVPNLDECIRILQSHSGKYEVFFNFTEKGKQARFVGNNVDLSDVMIEKLSRVIDKYKINIKCV